MNCPCENAIKYLNVSVTATGGMSIKWFNVNDVIAQNLRITHGTIIERHNTFPGWPK